MWADLAPGRQQGAWDPSGSVTQVLTPPKGLKTNCPVPDIWSPDFEVGLCFSNEYRARRQSRLVYKEQVAMLTVASAKGNRALTVVAEVGTDKNVRAWVYFCCMGTCRRFHSGA